MTGDWHPSILGGVYKLGSLYEPRFQLRYVSALGIPTERSLDNHNRYTPTMPWLLYESCTGDVRLLLPIYLQISL